MLNITINITVVIISQFIPISDYQVVHLKYMKVYVLIIPQKNLK